MNISPRLFALVPAAVAINLVVGRVVQELGLPIYLDTIGTMLVAVLAGLSGGLLVGTLSQMLSGMLGGYIWLAFTPIQWLIALLAAVAAGQAGFRTRGANIGWGLACGLACGAASAVISYFAFGGVTATGVTGVAILLKSLGASQPVAVTAASICTDLLDKTLAFLVVGALLRAMPKRILGRFPLAALSVGR